MIKLYGIKNCDTVKKARHWLKQHELPYEFHDYRVDGLDLALLQRFEAELGWEVMLNKRSTSWRQLTDEQKTQLDRNKALQLMLEIPTLIKRPILENGEHFLIGFNDKHYQTLL
jgi:Spx/MgsR family transcriptional regulator